MLNLLNKFCSHKGIAYSGLTTVCLRSLHSKALPGGVTKLTVEGAHGIDHEAGQVLQCIRPLNARDTRNIAVDIAVLLDSHPGDLTVPIPSIFHLLRGN